MGINSFQLEKIVNNLYIAKYFVEYHRYCHVALDEYKWK